MRKLCELWLNLLLLDAEMPTSFFAVFSTFFKLQILVILSKMPQNTFFFKDHFVYSSMETNWKILFFKPKYFFHQKYFFLSLELRGWHLCRRGNIYCLHPARCELWLLCVCVLAKGVNQGHNGLYSSPGNGAYISHRAYALFREVKTMQYAPSIDPRGTLVVYSGTSL